MSKFIIDIGSWKTAIYDLTKDKISVDRTLLAISKKSGKILEIGDRSLLKLQELGEDSVEIVKPVKRGDISDVDLMHEYLKRRLKMGFLIRKSVFIVPDQPGGKLRSIRKLSQRLNLKSYYLSNPISVFFSISNRIDDMIGKIVMDMGYEKTEISILSIGGVMKSMKTDLGWKKIEKFIKHKLRERMSITIDSESLEALKKFLGKSITNGEEVFMKGMDAYGKPIKIRLDLSELKFELENLLKDRIFRLKKVIKDSSAEIAGNVLKGWILITGGLTFFRGIRGIIEEIFDLKVKRVKDPIVASTEGGRVISKDKSLSRIFLKSVI